MRKVSSGRDAGKLEINMDAWTAPFWKAAEEGRLELPSCGDCELFRWPPGPFCPRCHSQSVVWKPAGPGRLFSYTIVPGQPAREGEEAPAHVPALIAFAEAGDMRMLGSLVDAPLDAIRIDAEVEVDWVDAANTRIPVFRLAGDASERGDPT